MPVLNDVAFVGMNEKSLTLTGFERQDFTDYAQSWLVVVDITP